MAKVNVQPTNQVVSIMPDKTWLIIHTNSRVVVAATIDPNAKPSDTDSVVEWKGGAYDLANGPWKLNDTCDQLVKASQAEYDDAMTLPLPPEHKAMKDLADSIHRKNGVDPDVANLLKQLSDHLFRPGRRD